MPASDFKFSPKCSGSEACCGYPPDCEGPGDDFNRANDTDLGSEWTEHYGDWAIATNLLRVTTADSVAEFSPTYDPDAVPVSYVKFRFIGDDGDEIRCCIMDTTALPGEAYAIQFTIGSPGKISLWGYSAGPVWQPIQEYEYTLGAGAWHDVIIGSQSANNFDNGGLLSTQVYYGLGEDLIANFALFGIVSFVIGCGSNTGDMYFENFQTLHGETDRAGCRAVTVCPWFLTDDPPETLSLVIEDAADCTPVPAAPTNIYYLSLLNGTYPLEKRYEIDEDGKFRCIYEYIFDPPLQIHPSGGTDAFLTRIAAGSVSYGPFVIEIFGSQEIRYFLYWGPSSIASPGDITAGDSTSVTINEDTAVVVYFAGCTGHCILSY